MSNALTPIIIIVICWVLLDVAPDLFWIGVAALFLVVVGLGTMQAVGFLR